MIIYKMVIIFFHRLLTSREISVIIGFRTDRGAVKISSTVRLIQGSRLPQLMDDVKGDTAEALDVGCPLLTDGSTDHRLSSCFMMECYRRVFYFANILNYNV